MNNKNLIQHFDKLSEFCEPMIDRGIEENRKGLFCIKVTDKDGNPLPGVKINADLSRHEFKFGCAIFLLDQFPDERRNKLYRERSSQSFLTML